MRYLLFIILIPLAFKSSRAQSVTPAIVNVAGNTYTQSNITYEWSVGEMALVETMINTQGSITNGLLQPNVLGQAAATNNNTVTTIVATNILTPNGDGKNDTWMIQDIQLYPNNTVTVFDKGGRVVFSKRGYNNDWDGTLKGVPLAQGTYYYTVDLGVGKQQHKGFITIIKSR